MKKPNYPFGVVEWMDAHATLEELSYDQIVKEHKPLRVQTSGYILIDDDRGVWIASEWLPGDTDTWRGNSFVPRGMVTTVTYRRKKSSVRIRADRPSDDRTALVPDGANPDGQPSQ